MKSYVLCVCFAILFCVAVGILVPGKKYSGIMKIVSGVFILHTILTPLEGVLFSDYTLSDISGVLSDDNGFFDIVEQSKTEFDHALINGSYSRVLNEISQQISKINGAYVTVSSGDGEASVYLTGVYKGKRKQISDFLKKTYGIEAVFTD